MSEAVIIFQGCPFAYTDTNAKNGDVVSFGWDTAGDAIAEIGRGKISRAKKNLASIQKDGLHYAHVNYGGGAPI